MKKVFTGSKKQVAQDISEWLNAGGDAEWRSVSVIVEVIENDI